MSRDVHDDNQPTLWGSPSSAIDVHPRRTVSRMRTAAAATPPRDEVGALWSIDQVATYLGVPKQTIYGWRTTGYGPRGFRVGKHLRWHSATVQQWSADLERDQ